MFIKKPFVTLVLFIGMGLLALFSISYIWLPFIQSSKLLMVLAEALAIIFCLIAVFVGVSYFIMKKQQDPAEKREGLVSNLSGNLTRLPVNNGEAPVIRMPMTG